MWIGVLGPTAVTAADGAVEVATAKHRALISALALARGRAVSSQTLIESLWGTDAPPSAAGTLQTYVSAVRRLLQPGLAPRAPSSYLPSVDGGYRLVADIDATTFATGVREVHAALGPLAGATVPVADDPAAASELLGRVEAALALWRGEPYADLPDSDVVRPERGRLQELRHLAREDHATLLVALGRDAEAAVELEALTAELPLRERPWLLLAAALARAGRQADGLAAVDRLRTVLGEELGLEPSAAANAVQTAILRHELPAAPATSPAAPAVSASPASPAARAARAAAGPRPPGAEGPRIALPDWSLVGRSAHLATLEDALAAAGRGTPQFVTVRGEPGAGKTRLGTEFAVRAQYAGALVLVGRCSQEEDAPPLWPWLQALGRRWPASPTPRPTTTRPGSRWPRRSARR
nr:BTAD domain-containing putative transcriptional regulator [Nocardioides sambongensis]